MNLFIILLLQLFVCSQSFIPRLSPLQSIVSYKAVISGVVVSISEEFLSDNIVMRQVLLNQGHNIDILYFVLLIGTILTKNKYNDKKGSQLDDFKYYSTIQKKTKILLFAIMIILNRNIENAI
jgi:hypothetical protein